MNIFERQAALSKSLYEINTNTVKGLVSLQRDNIQQYFETNKNFGSKISDVEGITGFVDLQKEYGQTLWSNAKGAVEAQNEIVKDAFSNSKEALKIAFNKEEEVTAEVITEKPKAKAKAKPKTKKTAAAA